MSSDDIEKMSRNIEALQEAIGKLYGKIDGEVIKTINILLEKIREQKSAIEMVITKYNLLNAAEKQHRRQISENTAGTIKNRANIDLLETEILHLRERQQREQDTFESLLGSDDDTPPAPANEDAAEDTVFQEVEGFPNSSDEGSDDSGESDTQFSMSMGNDVQQGKMQLRL